MVESRIELRLALLARVEHAPSASNPGGGSAAERRRRSEAGGAVENLQWQPHLRRVSSPRLSPLDLMDSKWALTGLKRRLASRPKIAMKTGAFFVRRENTLGAKQPHQHQHQHQHEHEHVRNCWRGIPRHFALWSITERSEERKQKRERARKRRVSFSRYERIGF